MKRFYTAGTLMALCLVGCASPTKITVQERIGPPPAPVSAAAGNAGTLQVFSARERAPIDLNMEEFCANEFGNNANLYEKAHTGYLLCAEDGKVLDKIRNARGIYDETPKSVALPAGNYRIEATAERVDGTTFLVDLPVVIRSGLKTVIHLETDWRPKGQAADTTSVVRIYDGRIIGWRAEAPTLAGNR